MSKINSDIMKCIMNVTKLIITI